MNARTITALRLGIAPTFAMGSVSSAYKSQYQSGVTRSGIVTAELYGGVASDALGSIVESDRRAALSESVAMKQGYGEKGDATSFGESCRSPLRNGTSITAASARR